MDKLGQISTPNEYVSILLDKANYISDVVGKKVLENSCGDGNVLVEIVRRYIIDAKRKKWSCRRIKKGLLSDIVAYETDKKAIKNSVSRLRMLCEELEIEPVDWNIKNTDYLKADSAEYDFIIGNPPYITYHDLTISQRDYLKRNFISCKNGRFDYAYAFIEKSVKELSKQGTLSYLVPFSIFRNKHACELRKLIQPRISGILDFTGVDVFPNRTIGTAIIICNQKTSVEFNYERPCDGIKKGGTKEFLSDKWIFDGNTITKETESFGNFFDVSNSVATLKNDIFIIEEKREEGGYIFSEENSFEKALIFDAVSPRSKRLGRRKKIIFPYDISKDLVMHIPEDDFMKRFPKTYEYLLSKKEELDKRDVSPGSRWYEYGRSQALSSVLKEKLLMPMIISGQVVTYYSDRNEIPFAGYYISAKTDNMSLKDAANIIESKEFYEYAKRIGTPTTKNSFRLSVSDIMAYRVRKTIN